MQMYLILAVFVTLATAAPPRSELSPNKDAEILKYESDNIGVGEYNFNYETSNGISRSEYAEIKNAGTDQEIMAVRGSISWSDSEGNKYVMEYTADENGFQPTGAHLVR